jgi:hypothetical protein
MTMRPESEKYKKVVEILKRSDPILDSTEDLEREVIKRISRENKKDLYYSEIIDFLFGWVYIGWVRKSLITASVMLVMFFVWQQGIILKQISFLNRQTIVSEGGATYTPAVNIEKGILLYKFTGRRFLSKSITIPKKQMDQLLESVNELQENYKDLIKMIEDDPELKRMIEKKMIENNRTKIKL